MKTYASTAWLASYYKPIPQARFRLFCFPYAGGSASVFFRWMTLLAPHVEVCPVQLPGRSNRIAEPCLTSINDVAELACQALRPYFEMPFAFFGHSLGALIAYEMAQRLRSANRTGPEIIIASAHRAPQVPFPKEPSWHLPDAEFKEYLEELNGTPKEILQDKNLLELVLPVMRADFKLDETYVHPGDYQPLDCPITVIGGKKDMDVPEDHLQAWRQVTRGSCKLEMIDGDHFFIHSQEALLVHAVRQAVMNHR